ncbi:MAG TPA: ribosome silencing factor [Actinomycetota bacterium]
MTGTDQQRRGGQIPPSRDTAAAAARAAASKQAQDIVVLDVSELIVITDHFVICTATSSRQIRTVVEEIERALREQLNVKPARREGEGDAGWWLLDYIDVVIHVFGPEERAYYDLERLWRDAPRVGWEESDAVSSAR